MVILPLKRRECSHSINPTCINMSSISADTTYLCFWIEQTTCALGRTTGFAADPDQQEGSYSAFFQKIMAHSSKDSESHQFFLGLELGGAERSTPSLNGFLNREGHSGVSNPFLKRHTDIQSLWIFEVQIFL